MSDQPTFKSNKLMVSAADIVHLITNGRLANKQERWLHKQWLTEVRKVYANDSNTSQTIFTNSRLRWRRYYCTFLNEVYKLFIDIDTNTIGDIVSGGLKKVTFKTRYTATVVHQAKKKD